MEVLIAAVGRIKQGAEHDLCTHYLKQLRPTPTLIEIADAPSNLAKPARLAREAEAILTQHKPGGALVLLDAGGDMVSSESFAAMCKHLAQQGTKRLVFALGGHDGLCHSLQAKAHRVLAFGPMIWPHKLARVMLCEQLFRAQCIHTNHPYHNGH
jgi:23S rRNA (pseudouridine1915-N3)-methyltransferase